MEENNSSILVVDDNPEIREIIQVLLGGEGYLVETAGNGCLLYTSMRIFDEHSSQSKIVLTKSNWRT